MKICGIAFVLLLGASSLSALTATSTTISSSLNPSIYGQSVTFTANVSPQPPNGEIVTFEQGQSVIGTGGLSGGTATFATSALTPGNTRNIKAVYKGDSTFSGSTSSPVGQLINQATTTTTLSSSQNPVNSGQPVTFTAQVSPQISGPNVTGNVLFYSGSAHIGTISLSSGVAALTTTTLASGTDSITAVYKGSSAFITSTSNAINQGVEVGTTTNATMTWDGITRYYMTYVPGVLPANPPMLVMLHATNFSVPPNYPSMLNYGWQPLADLNEFILVQPASTLNTKSGAWNWNSYFLDPAFQTNPGPDDSGFLRALIVKLSSKYNVNPNMVYVTGFSSGAQMAERVGVDISDLVAAIAPTSGELVDQEVPPPGLPGPAVAPVSVQEWQGTADTELPPCNYGTTVYSGVTFTVDTVDDTFNYWVGQNGCSTLQTAQPLCANSAPNNANDAATPNMPGMTGNIATSCNGGSNVEVQFIWEPGTGHSWVTKNNTARWQFFSAHPKQ
jgi:poly(3-hydroxybutyrate) depolymerase